MSEEETEVYSGSPPAAPISSQPVPSEEPCCWYVVLLL